jgi:hypothetical protein
LLVPAHERESIVSAVEAKIVAEFSSPSPAEADQAPPIDNGNARSQAKEPSPPLDPRDQELIVVYPAKQRDGYVEQIERTFSASPAKTPAKNAKRRSAL